MGRAAIAATARGFTSEISRSIRIAAMERATRKSSLKYRRASLSNRHAEAVEDEPEVIAAKRKSQPTPAAPSTRLPLPRERYRNMTARRPAPTAWTTGPTDESSISGLCPVEG